MGGARSTRGVDEYKLLSENLNERDHMEDLSVYGRITLKWILIKSVVYAIDSSGSCEHGNEASGPIKGKEFD
jgi:hypothetical protein